MKPHLEIVDDQIYICELEELEISGVALDPESKVIELKREIDQKWVGASTKCLSVKEGCKVEAIEGSQLILSERPVKKVKSAKLVLTSASEPLFALETSLSQFRDTTTCRVTLNSRGETQSSSLTIKRK